VLHGTATFETVPPDPAEMASRLARVREAGSPWLVARDAAGNALGYAYAAQFRDRAAYRFACENSVYIRHDLRGQGIGTALLSALLAESETAGFRQMIAVIAGTEPASIALHARAGFERCGMLTAAGRKHGRWIDVVYMQRALGDGASTPPVEEPQ
jgi:L-amino acid N-acyltransferase YncA